MKTTMSCGQEMCSYLSGFKKYTRDNALTDTMKIRKVCSYYLGFTWCTLHSSVLSLGHKVDKVGLCIEAPSLFVALPGIDSGSLSMHSYVLLCPAVLCCATM